MIKSILIASVILGFIINGVMPSVQKGMQALDNYNHCVKVNTALQIERITIDKQGLCK